MSTTIDVRPETPFSIEPITYPVMREKIAELAAQYAPLEIAGVDDKAGFAAVHAARLNVKALRVGVEKRRKELKSGALEYGRLVDSAAKALTELLTPIELQLEAKETAVEQEKARLKRIAEEAEHARIQARVDALLAVGASVPYPVVAGMSEEVYQAKLADHTEIHQAKLAAKAKEEAEAARLKAEEDERRRLEREKLAAERAELDRQRKEQEAAAAKERERLDAERKAQEAEQRKRQADLERREAEVAAEKKRFAEAEAARQRLIEQQRREQERAAEQQRREQEAAQRAQRDTEARLKREADEAERKRAEAAKPLRERILDVLSEAAVEISNACGPGNVVVGRIRSLMRDLQCTAIEPSEETLDEVGRELAGVE